MNSHVRGCFGTVLPLVDPDWSSAVLCSSWLEPLPCHLQCGLLRDIFRLGSPHVGYLATAAAALLAGDGKG